MNSEKCLNSDMTSSSIILIPMTVQSAAVPTVQCVAPTAAVLPYSSQKIPSKKSLKDAKKKKADNTQSAGPRWRPILPKIRPNLPSAGCCKSHPKMDYCDCNFCSAIHPSLAWRSAPADLPRPRPIRPAPVGFTFPSAVQQLDVKTAIIPASNALMILPPAVPSTSAATTILSNCDIIPKANSASDSSFTSTTVENHGDSTVDDKKFKHRTWYNEDTENETKSFRDFLKMAACEFKRSIEPCLDGATNKLKKDTKTKRKKRHKQEKPPTRTDSDAMPPGLTSPLPLGNDRFSPSSVSCASIDSGFADAMYPPSSPESSSAVPTSFATASTQPEEHAEAASDLLKRRLDENNNIVNGKLNKNEQADKAEAESKLSQMPDGICFSTFPEDEQLEPPSAKVRRISDVFFNSKTSDFVNNLLKRSRQNSENQDANEADVELANVTKKVRFAVPAESIAIAAITVMQRRAEKLSVSATISPKKSVVNVDEKKIAKLYLSAKKQPVILISEKTVPDDIDHFNLASTSTVSSDSMRSSSADDSADDATLFECACQWIGCEKRFRTDNQLYDHVLGCHLEMLRPDEKESLPTRPLTRQKSKNGRKAAETSLFCKWDQCKMCLKRGDPKKQFEWLIEHYTTRHAPRAQPFACLFKDCNLRFRTRRTLNDHLLSAHDSEKPNGKRHSNFNSNCVPEIIFHSFNYSPLVRVPQLADMIDRRTITWMRSQIALKNSKEPHIIRRQCTSDDVLQQNTSRSTLRKMRTSTVQYLSKLDMKSNHSFGQRPAVAPQRKMNKDEKTLLLLELCRNSKAQSALTTGTV